MAQNPLNPRILTVPFANTSSLKDSIPDSGAVQPGAVTYDKGFGNETMTPIAAGGTPPRGQAFNGILSDITDNILFQQRNTGYRFDPNIASSNGYPRGAILRPNSINDPYWYESAVDENTGDFNTNPSLIGSTWKRVHAGIPDYFGNKNYYQSIIVTADDGYPYICLRPNGPDTPAGPKTPTTEPDYWINLADWVADQLNIQGGIPKWSAVDCYSPLPHIVWGSDLMLYIALQPSGPGTPAGPKNPMTTTGYWVSLPAWVKKHMYTPDDIVPNLPETIVTFAGPQTLPPNNVRQFIPLTGVTKDDPKFYNAKGQCLDITANCRAEVSYHLTERIHSNNPGNAVSSYAFGINEFAVYYLVLGGIYYGTIAGWVNQLCGSLLLDLRAGDRIKFYGCMSGASEATITNARINLKLL